MEINKTCLIIGSFTFPYGMAATARIRNIAYGLRDNGFKVYILAVSPPFGIEGKTKWHEFDDNIFIRFIKKSVPERSWRNHTLLSLFFLFNLISATKIVDELHFKEKLDFVFIYGRGYLSLRKIINFCKRHQLFSILDIVELPATYSSLLELCFHPLRVDSVIGDKILVKKADLITCISTKIASRYNNGLKYILPSVEDWNTSHTPFKNKGTFTFLYVGSFMEKDNPELIFNFLSGIQERRNSFLLKVIGKYEYSQEGIRWKKRFVSKFNQQVEFLGEVSDSELQQSISSVDAVLLLRDTSILEEYTFPTRIVEFLKSGRMIVTSPKGDIPNYLTHLESAFFIEYDKVNKALNEITPLFQNRELVTKIGKEGFDIGKKYMNRKIHASAIISIYRKNSNLDNKNKQDENHLSNTNLISEPDKH